MYDRRKVQADFGNAASVYDDKAILQKQILLEALDMAAIKWPASGFIADIGSGTGMLPRMARNRGYAWEIIGADMAYGMCAFAASKGFAAVNSDAENLPFKNDMFDGVFSSLMLQWANNPKAAFAEMHRILKPGGYAVITTFTQGTLKELQASFKAVDGQTHTSHFRNMMEWGADASAAGFAIKQMQEKTHTEYYDNTRGITQNLKAIGAKHKPSAEKSGSLTKAQFAQFEEEYQTRFNTDKGLPVTWKVLTLVLYKK
jgi:malonyl-CoA O-methyltransferase